MKMRTLGVVALALAVASSAGAQPAINGTADPAYGAPLSLQNTNTGFGDARSGDPINCGAGSEIDAVFAMVSGDRLYVTVTGNLEPNFNKLEVFIDSVAGGVNVIDGTNLPVGVDGYCCGGPGTTDGALQRMDGLKFDAGFAADYYLTFSHGFEEVGADPLRFWAMSVHYADLTQGYAGANVAAGFQVAQRGLPNVLRGTRADFNVDGDADGADFLTLQRHVGTASGATRNDGDANGDGDVDSDDLNTWSAAFGFHVSSAPFDQYYYAPQDAEFDDSDILVGPVLPGLYQSALIDRVYAFSIGGCIDPSGLGCMTRELEFALQRDFGNTIDLHMALDNSNIAGVSGDGSYETATTEDPSSVLTGIEFSIPLWAIGNPTGDIRLTLFVNGGGHDYASNQFSGVGVLQGNLGGAVDLASIDGVQYVTLPQPGL